jgi:hypothetical protein
LSSRFSASKHKLVHEFEGITVAQYIAYGFYELQIRSSLLTIIIDDRAQQTCRDVIPRFDKVKVLIFVL